MKKLFMLMLMSSLSLFSISEASHHTTSSSDNNSCEPVWGYFYLREFQYLGYQGEGDETTPAVDWTNAVHVNSDGVSVDPTNPYNILIAFPGIYLVNYSTTVKAVNVESDPGDAQFALYLNEADYPIPGSTYAVGNALNGGDIIASVTTTEGDQEVTLIHGLQSQCNGQVVFIVTQPNSVISLLNQSPNGLLIDPIAGVSDDEEYEFEYGFGVSASIFVQRLAELY